MPPAVFEQTAQQLLDRRTEEHPEKPAFVYVTDGDEQATSFAELQAEANRVAAALHTHGIGPGDHVAILLENRPEYISLVYGALRLGAVVNPYNAMWGKAELQAVLQLEIDEWPATETGKIVYNQLATEAFARLDTDTEA